MAAYRGTLVDTPLPGTLRIRPDHVIVVDDGGNIVSVAWAAATPPAVLEAAQRLPRYSFLLPTFADLHIHAPQYLYAGTGLDLPLMQWLDTYTYAAEERVDADHALASRLYQRLVKRLIQAGTGCIVAFGTIGVQANLILAQACADAGLRAFIGKLSMDQSPRPTYGETLSGALDRVGEFLDAMDALNSPTVKPVLTPRFVPTCSDLLLRSLADIAKERGVLVQSHMCESTDQEAWVRSTRGRNDEDVFDSAGLLGPGTVQAHVTGLDEKLMDLVKDRGVTVAHCPLSNAYFSDKPFPLREAIDAGLKIGLGSDIAGGYALPIQTAMREAVVVARLREGARREHARTHAGETSLTPPSADVPDMPDVPSTPAEAMPGIADPMLADALKMPVSDTYSRETDKAQKARDAGREVRSEEPDEEDRGLRVDWIEALYLATAGGKSALGFQGVFEPGAEFDAQLIALAEPDGEPCGPLDLFDLPRHPDARWWTEAVERWWCIGDDRNRAAVWVQGRQVM